MCQIYLNKAGEKLPGEVAKPIESESSGLGLEYLQLKTAQMNFMFIIFENYSFVLFFFFFLVEEGNSGVSAFHVNPSLISLFHLVLSFLATIWHLYLKNVN